MRCSNCLRVINKNNIKISPTLDPDYPSESNLELNVTCPFCYASERIIIEKQSWDKMKGSMG